MTNIPYKDFKGNIAENLADPVRDQDGATKNYVDIAVAGVSLSSVWPVGSVYISVVSTNPSTLLGFGTWEAFGAGKTLVGLNGSDTDFDTAEETGGAKTINIAHAHTINDHTHAITGSTSTYTADVPTGGSSGTNKGGTHSHTAGTLAASGAPSNKGMDSQLSATQSIVQPYIVTYFWKRTA